MSEFKTEQEAFWAGDFGREYIGRNDSAKLIAANSALFGGILGATHGIESAIELGSNVGMNLHALRHLQPGLELSAVEINPEAAEVLRQSESLNVTVHETSILEFKPPRTYDFAFTKGVLIHINPDALPTVYDALYAASNRYVMVAEYYNPTPVAIPYRGHEDRLFKRDFAGEIMDRFGDLRLVDYRFAYHRDPVFPHDDVTWFLMEKVAS